MRYTINYLQDFRPTPMLIGEDYEPEDNFKLNHYLATLHLERKKREVLDGYGERQLIKSILKKPLPNPQEQADILIRLLSKFDSAISFQGGAKLRYYTGSQHPDMFHALIEYLLDRKWIKCRHHYLPNNESIYKDIMLTVQGWEYFAQLQKGELSHNKGFMAMQFNNDDLQNILEDYFKPAMKRIGFELTKLDDILKPGLIDNHMLVAIQTSDFIVADLSDNNRGVYLEAGYAMGLGKTVIFTCEKTAWETEDIHFDVNHYKIIFWNKGSKKSAEDAAEKLTSTVRAEFPNKVKISNDE